MLRRALNQAVAWNLAARNVAQLARPPRAERPDIAPLTPEQARQLLAVVRGDRIEALYTVALALGLRKGEALGLRWQDVDLDAGKLAVNHQLQRLGGKLVLVEPKTKQGRRTLTLPDTVVSALRAHRIRQLEERLAAGELWRDSGHVFTSTIGTPLDERNVVRLFQRAREQAGVPPLRFHDLRHSAASLLLAQGVHPRVVMELLGHSNISMTLGTYSHVLPPLSEEAARKMDAVLTGS